MQPSPVSRRSLDELEHELISLAQRINSAEYEFLVLVREFDIRQGWRAWHFNNCAEWLNMKCGISLGTAREKVRVALALFDLQQCSEAFAAGKLSYSKARALTRVADRHNEDDLLEHALSSTASQVEEHCRQLRNAQRRRSTEDANRSHRARYLSRVLHEDGDMTISAELPKEAGDLVMKAIEIALAAEEGEVDDNSANEDSFFAKQADALVEIAKAYLAGGSGDRTSSADHYQVMVHVDELALRDEGGKSEMPIESVRRIMCDASIVPVVEDADGTPLDVGRKQRVVSPPLRRALLSRDKHCRFPGCSHDKWLDAHHVMHWADGGETSLANTLLLCSKHHRLLHEGGFTIQKNFEGEWYFKHANGRLIDDARLYHYHEADPSRDGLRRVEQDEVREPPRLYVVI